MSTLPRLPIVFFVMGLPAACSSAAGTAYDTVVNHLDDAEVVTDLGRDATSTRPDTTIAPETNDTRDLGSDPDVVARIDWAILQHPATITAAPDETVQVYGRVFVAGRPPEAGAAPGLDAEAGLGQGELGTWTWAAATFNVDVDLANDEFRATLSAPATDGTYRYAFRFRIDGGDWVYADLDGTDDGFDAADTGTLTVVTPAPARVDWCRLQHPPAVAANPSGPVGTIYVRVYELGVTDTLAASSPDYPVRVAVGYGPAGAETTDAWTWSAAQWASDAGNDDEFEGTFAAPATLGEYRFAARAWLGDAPDALTLDCDLTGSDDGFVVGDTGVLTVAEPPPATIDYAIVRPATLGWKSDASPGTVEVVVYEDAVTPGEGAGDDIAVELGHGAPDADLEAFAWIPAAYAGDEDGLGALDNDVYSATLPSLPIGPHRVVARVRVADGPATLVDASGTPDGFDVATATLVTVSSAEPGLPDWCRLDAAERIVTTPSASLGKFSVQIYEAGLTPNAGTALVAQIGIGPAGADPSSGFTWTNATYESSVGNDDIHAATLVAPATEGGYDIAGRVGFAEGGVWRTCDRDGSDNGYLASQAARLEVAAPRADFCKIQWPLDDVTTQVGVASADLFVAIYEAHVTGESGSHTPPVTSEVGYGPSGSTPDGTWTWSAGSFNGYLDNGFGQKNNDEHKGRVTPTASGAFDWAWRVSLDGGTTWVLCDEAGSQPYDPTKAGNLTVQ